MTDTRETFDRFGRIKAENPQFAGPYLRQRAEAEELYRRFTSRNARLPQVQILADDVGMGKTRVTCILLFAMFKRQSEMGKKQPCHAIVVTPTRMVADNWMRELTHYRRNCLDSEFARLTSIEHIGSAIELRNRLEAISSASASTQKIASLFAADHETTASEFLAFCLREYFDAEQLSKTEIKHAAELRCWIQRLERKPNCNLNKFHRYFSQEEVLGFMRFLRRFAAEGKYKADHWLFGYADPKRFEAACSRPRVGRLSNFLESFANLLNTSDEPVGRGSRILNASRREVADAFLRLAAEVMPRLAARAAERRCGEHAEATTERQMEMSQQKELKRLEAELAKVLAKNACRRQGKSQAAPCIEKLGPTLAQSCMAKILLAGDLSSIRGEKAAAVVRAMEHVRANTSEADDKRLDKVLGKGGAKLLLHMMCKYQTAASASQVPRPGWLSPWHSPWSLPNWTQYRAANQTDFFEAIAQALHLTEGTKRFRTGVNGRPETAVRFIERCRELCRFEFESKPAKLFDERLSFWKHRKLRYHVFVLYARDFQGQKDSKRASICGTTKFFDLAVIDEAHNWRHGRKGASAFRDDWARHVKHLLLITATPLQLDASDLERMITAVYPREAWEAQGPLETLFVGTDGFAEGRLADAAKHRDNVVKHWGKLQEKDRKCLEAKAAAFESSATIEAKLECWTGLASNPDEAPDIRALARAVLDFRDYQHKQLALPLKEIMMKHRAPMNRRFVCGRDVERVLGGKALSLEHDRLYQVEGIANSATLASFIAMRISALAEPGSKYECPRLTLGLPSSYEAFFESALGQTMCNRAGRYLTLLDVMKAEARGIAHPKIRATVQIVLKNLLERGEKTLVFCERIMTVQVIAEAICKEAANFVIKHGWDDAHLLERFAMLSSEASASASSDAADTSKAKTGALSALCKEMYASLFGHAVSVWPPAEQGQKTFDARSLLVLDHAVKVLSRDENRRRAMSSARANLLRLVGDAPNGESQTVSHAIEIITGKNDDGREAKLRSFSSQVFPYALICSPVTQEGVNLHMYCRSVVLHDLNWNPAILEQRVGRVDRLGGLAAVKGEKVDVYVPFLSASYDEYQYRSVLERAELQELAFGSNEFLADDDDVDDDPAEEKTKLPNSRQPRRALIGNLIFGLFEMDLSIWPGSCNGRESLFSKSHHPSTPLLEDDGS